MLIEPIGKGKNCLIISDSSTKVADIELRFELEIFNLCFHRFEFTRSRTADEYLHRKKRDKLHIFYDLFYHTDDFSFIIRRNFYFIKKTINRLKHKMPLLVDDFFEFGKLIV